MDLDYIDPLFASADFRLDQLRDTSSCPSCGSLEPAMIWGRECSDCPGEIGEAVKAKTLAAVKERESHE